MSRNWYSMTYWVSIEDQLGNVSPKLRKVTLSESAHKRVSRNRNESETADRYNGFEDYLLIELKEIVDTRLAKAGFGKTASISIQHSEPNYK